MAAAAMVWSAGPACAQTLSFFRQFTTPSADRAVAVAADGSGVYVVAHNPLRGAASIRKYDAGGGELWTREFTAGPQEPRAAADGSGVYVAGYTTAGQFLRKFGAAGEDLWVRQLEFMPMGSLAADSTGVYVAGGNSIPTGNFPRWERFVRKYDPSGAEAWTRRSMAQFEFPLALAADSTGVYLLGIASVPASGNNAMFIRKWDLRGAELWERRPPFSPGTALMAAAEPSGFFVVTDVPGSRLLHRYDAEGNELWRRPLESSSSDVYPGAVVADSTGVYVTGTTSMFAPALPGQCRSGSASDSFVRKFALDGTELWTREFGTPDAAWAVGLAADGAGIYAVGRAGTAQVAERAAGASVIPSLTTSAFLARLDKTAAEGAAGPRILPDCVVNAASYVGGSIAPGEVVTIFGSGIGPSLPVRSAFTGERTLPATVAETRILFGDVAAPLLYVSDKQSSAIVPYAVAGKATVDVRVEYKGVRSAPVTMPVTAARPGIFTMDASGRGQGAILNEDGTLNSASNPAARGSVIAIFGTGGGETAAGLIDGQIVGDVVPRAALPVSVFFDAGLPTDSDYEIPPKKGEVLYAGGSRGSIAGLLQINVRVPADAAPGSAAPLALVIGSEWVLRQATVALR